jgi:uncharacterized membrane protein
MDSIQAALEQAGITRQDFSSGNTRQRGNSTNRGVNVGYAERLISGIGGGLLAGYGLSRRSVGGVALALLGGALVYRGVSGHCDAYSKLGINTATTVNPNVSVRGGAGIKVDKSIIINKSPEELYNFWRDVENLPRFMNHLESVRSIGDNRSHWVAKAPAGTTVEWDAEIYNEKENELIAWRSLESADVPNAGSVHFTPVGGGRETEVKVSLKYDPPGGIVGSAVARLFGENPEQQISEDLHRFKQVMETGEITTTAGQPSGRGAAAGT